MGYNKVFGYYMEISHANREPMPGRLHAQADAGQRRALHHAGAEGVRERGAGRRGAHRRAGRRRLSRSCCAGRRRCRPIASSGGASVGATLDGFAAWPRSRAHSRLRPARTIDDDDAHGSRAGGTRSSSDALTAVQLRRQRHRISTPRRPASPSSPGPTWPASRPTCARWR